MLEVADVFRQFGPSYIAAHGARMLPSHRRAIQDITACRTKAMGGHLRPPLYALLQALGAI